MVTLKRYWCKVDVKPSNDECWEWNASLNVHGYGQFRYKGKMQRAHRIAYELTFGAIPDGLIICHHCDNRKCCNPVHLFKGTHKDNACDRESKGRGGAHLIRGDLNYSRKYPELMAWGDKNGSRLYPEKRPRGEENKSSTLTTKEVVLIREKYKRGSSQDSIAKIFGVSQHTISNIVRRKTWAHVSEGV